MSEFWKVSEQNCPMRDLKLQYMNMRIFETARFDVETF